MRLILLAIMTLAAVAEGDATSKMTVVIGEPKELHLGGPIMMGKCDDASVVKVDTSEGAVRLVGLKEGHTLCGFWATPGMGTHTVVEVNVVISDDDSSNRPEPK